MEMMKERHWANVKETKRNNMKREGGGERGWTKRRERETEGEREGRRGQRGLK